MNIKYKTFTLLFIAGTLVSSCKDYLNVEHFFADRQTEERIFKNRDYTDQWLANCYNKLLKHNLEIGHFQYSLTNFSDDIIVNEDNYNMLKSGIYDHTFYKESWSLSYAGIRQASVMINHMGEGGEFTVAEVKQYKAQARFIRAYLYWLLLRKYGPVPLLPDAGVDYNGSYEALSFPRNSYDEIADFISAEMVLAARDLPLRWDNRNVARPTRGAALATRAKVLLYAASPLANGNTEMADFVDDKGNLLISQQYSEIKWAKAAAAAKDVINLNRYKLYTAGYKSVGTIDYPATIAPPHNPEFSDKNFPDGWADIDPFESYRALFNGDLYVADNPEMIFTRGDNEIGTSNGVLAMTRHQMPQAAGGLNYQGITLKQCEAYDMNDGTPFDRQKIRNKYGAQNMFVKSSEVGDFKPTGPNVWKEFSHREPRFYASVAFSGALWNMSSALGVSGNTNMQIFYYRGESEGRINGDRWQRTGIGMMKYVNPKDNGNNGGRFNFKVEVAIRYADVLLMYAEALNELIGAHAIPSWDGIISYNLHRDINELSAAIRPVRIRAGVPDYEQVVYGNQESFRKKLKHERQIELLGENQRYYDLRRWKDAPIEEGEQIYGFNTLISRQNASLFYDPVRVSQLETTFSRKMYFWPIDWDELRKNKRLTQAPGWQTFN